MMSGQPKIIHSNDHHTNKDIKEKKMTPTRKLSKVVSQPHFDLIVSSEESGAATHNPENETPPQSARKEITAESPRDISQSPENKKQVSPLKDLKVIMPQNDLNVTISREMTSLFDRLDKLDGENWTTWKKNVQENLEICNMWNIVVGKEKMPADPNSDDAKAWFSREKVARALIKNSLSSKHYQQVRHTKTAVQVWDFLVGIHEPESVQGKVDLIWKFWSMRCVEGASVKAHVEDVRSVHAELANMGIMIDNYLLAIALGKSLPQSYNAYVSSLFVGVGDIKEVDPSYIARKICEKEQDREKQSADAQTPSQGPCSNCKKFGHIEEDCDAGPGGKESQSPRQIWRKIKEAQKKTEQKESEPPSVRRPGYTTLTSRPMEAMGKPEIESIHFTSSSWTYDTWLVDSGANAHIANRREMFFEYYPSPGKLFVAGGMTTTFDGRGSVIMRGVVNGELNSFKLTNVLHVPAARHCLLSKVRLDYSGGKVRCTNGRCRLWNSEGKALATGILEGNLYKINAKAICFDENWE